MAQLLRMPEIAANMVEAVLSEWPLAENTSFSAGDPIATVETEKAVVDVPAEADGVLLRTLIEPGKSVTVGTPMAVLTAPGETVDDIDALVSQLTGGETPEGADEPSPAGAREVSQDGARAVTGEPPPSAGGDATGAGSPSAAAQPGGSPGGRIFASPLARRIAKENGLAVGDINGTGPGGRIVRDDVLKALTERETAAPQTAAPQTAAPQTAAPQTAPQTAAPQTAVPLTAVPLTAVTATSALQAASNDTVAPQNGATPAVREAAVPQTAAPRNATSPKAAPHGAGRGFRDIPHTRMRRAIAARLAESNREAPVFSIRGSARVDALLALREDINETTDVRVSVNDLIVAAAARAHLAVPEMNVIWMPDAVRQFEDVDIAVAVATDTGLVTPVVRGVQKLTISALARAGADVVTRARAGKLRQDELEGGTLTVTNLGVFGTEDFSAVLNPPQAAILAVGAARTEAVVTDGDLGVATVLRVTLSVDHRPVDGATAAKWMAAFLALLESPLRILT